MRIKFSNKTSSKKIAWLKKKARVRKVVQGTSERPRLCIFRSNKHMYAQLIDDSTRKTLASTSTVKFEKANLNVDNSKKIGLEIGKIAKDMKISQVVFDRNGFLFHGRVKAVADGAREAGLKF